MFSLWIFYNGYSGETDNKIRAALKLEDTGSGYNFEERDLSFDFISKKEAEKAGQRLVDLGLITRFSIFGPHSILNKMPKIF